MKSWTSIPFYLWKNTCKRWLEYPVSPISKMLIPALLGFLAAVVLTLFSEIERELRDQLSRNSVYSVLSSEFVTAEAAPTLLGKSYEEEIMWSDRYGAERIRQVRQPLLSASWRRTQNLPILSYSSSVPEWFDSGDLESPPSIWLLTDQPEQLDAMQEVALGGRRAMAEVRPMPAWAVRELALTQALAIPAEMMEPYLQKGFINHTVGRFSNLRQVEQYVQETTAYYRAERRQVKIVSALEILQNLEKITYIQNLARTFIVTGCGIILSLTLGSVSWLEYRQEAYLLALLRSFGTPSITLLFHMFLENLILVLIGMGSVFLVWKPLYQAVNPQIKTLGITASELPLIPVADIGIIVLSGVIGVLFAMIPVAFGLRKPIGLILQ